MKTIFGGRKQSTELLYLRLSKLARAKVILKLEFDTEDQVLFPLNSNIHQLKSHTPTYQIWVLSKIKQNIKFCEFGILACIALIHQKLDNLKKGNRGQP